MKFNDSFFNKVFNVSQSDVDSAIDMLDSVPKNHSEYPRALFYKSMILNNEDNDYESFNLFKKSILHQLNNGLFKNVEDAFGVAMGYIYDGEFELAIGLFDFCIDNNYNVAVSLKFKSECLANLEQYEDAIETIDEALIIDENNAEFLQLKSSYLGDLGNYDESLNCIDKAIELDSDDDENLRVKAITYFKMENYDEAFKYINLFIDRDPEDVDRLISKIKFYIHLDDYENVEKYFEIAENIQEDNLELLFTKTLYYLDQFELEKANDYVDKCLKIEPQSDLLAELKLSIVRELDDSDLLDDALNTLNDLNPDFLRSILNKYNDSEYTGSFNSDSSKFCLENIVYGEDYPSQSLNYNMYNVLSALKSDSDINNIYSNINLIDSYSDETVTGILIENNLIQSSIDEINIKKEASNKSPQELSQLLKQEGIVASGKKKKLVKLAIKHVPAIKFCSNFTLTDEGEDFLDEFSWFELYDECLSPFDLNDVSKYFDDHEGKDYVQLAEDYIGEHIKLAHHKEDFDYLDDCLISQSLLYMYQEDYQNCLCASLSELILKFNPIYEFEIFYAIYNVFSSIIIENIKKCLEVVNIDLEPLFYELWDLNDSEIDYAPKEEGFKFLKRALDDEDLDELYDEYEEKYIKVICRDDE